MCSPKRLGGRANWSRMFDRIRQCVTACRYRMRYPEAKVSGRAQLRRVRLGGGPVTICATADLADTVIGSNVTVHPACWVRSAEIADSVVLGPGTGLSEVKVGSYSYLAGDSTIHRTEFGRFCSVGKQLLCGLGSHPTAFVSTSPVFFSTRGQCNTTFAERDAFEEAAPVTIGSDVWIGARVFIRDGVHIGHGAIVGAGSVVVSDVRAYAVVAGVPARALRMRFSAGQIQRLLALQWWDWPESRLRAGCDRFADSDIEAFLCWAVGDREGVA